MNTKTKETLLFWLAVIGGISSIGSGIVALCSDKNKAMIALVAVIVFLVALFVAVLYVINKLLKNSNDIDYQKLSFFTRYEYIDKTHIRYDGYRLIQSKRPFLSEIKWRFKWTGTVLPKISSRLQNCDGQIIKNSSNDYDQVVLKFKKALFYNEPAVVHFHADMDDVDGVAQPHLDVKIEEPISVVNFHVILAYKDKDFSEQAVFKRKLINSAIPTDYVVLETIPFNVQSKSYEYVLTNPEVGYFYRLEWVK